MAVIQVALDVADLERALQIARESVAGGAEWLEAGTPLIKSEGMDAVRGLKRAFPAKTVVADMKAMDTGSFEAEMACKSGADVVTVLAAADDGTVKEAVAAAERFGARIAVDLIGAQHPVERARECVALGAKIVYAHAGIDQQMKGLTSLSIASQIHGKLDATIGIAGGIDANAIAQAARVADVVVVGGAITKAPDAAAAVRELRKAMGAKGGKATALAHFPRYSGVELAKAFLRASTPNISDALHRGGQITGVRNLFALKFAGPALTVRTHDGDWAKPVEAMERAEPGTVIAIDAQGGTTAVWGELATNSAVIRKLAGVVIDGATRDVDDIRRLKFPVCAKNVALAAGDPKGWGEIGCDISCGGQKVRTGDWIAGDENGVVVIPRELASETANRAIDVMEREVRLRSEIRRGKTLSEVAYLKKWEKVG